jgi:uncharacterized membrane protein YccC
MGRAAMAICGPLAVAFAVGQRALGVLVAMGGLLGTVADKGGPYAARVKQVGSAAVFGGAAGLAVGSFIHGRGWVAVVALVVAAGVSALLSAVSGIGSVTGLQLLIYTSFGLGPLGGLRPWWHTVVGFVLGYVWALVLTVPGWLLSPRAAEQHSVAAVYRALAGQLRAVGGPGFAEVGRGVAAAFNAAYDSLLAARSAAAGRDRRMIYLIGEPGDGRGPRTRPGGKPAAAAGHRDTRPRCGRDPRWTPAGGYRPGLGVGPGCPCLAERRGWSGAPDTGTGRAACGIPGT